MRERKTIMIVENDSDERHFMESAFRASEKFELLAAFNGGDEILHYLDRMDSLVPEVVLTDLNMPGRNGYDIIAYLRSEKKYEGVEIFVTSTSSTGFTTDKCRELGADGFIEKPELFIDYAPFVKELSEKIMSSKN